MTTTLRRVAALRALWTALSAVGRPGVPGVGARLGAVPRMLRLGLSGRYPFLDRGRLAMIALGLVYVVSPIDVVPEAFLAVFGLGDDALVAAWLVGAVLAEAGTFLDWERDRSRTVEGEVVS